MTPNDPFEPLSLDLNIFCASPEVRDSAPAKIALLRGPVYFEDTAWIGFVRYREEVSRFMAEVGLRVVADLSEGFAFLEQAEEGEPGFDWPKLLHRDRFSYDITCVLIVLREWLLTQETKPKDEWAPLKTDELLAQLRPFSRKRNANVEKEDKRWREAINRVVSMGYLKRWKEEDVFKVRPIVRAKVSLEVLKDMKKTLEELSGDNSQRDEEGDEE